MILNNKEKIGDLIRNERIAKKLSQLKLSSKAAISNTYLCDIEKNRTNPSLETLEKIFNALDVKIEWSNFFNK